uniref:Uncharacterized protein n=1 Tax=Anguilla anguilla TaxID=7936 RepID=A0A0E9WGN0_ANGAN
MDGILYPVKCILIPPTHQSCISSENVTIF